MSVKSVFFQNPALKLLNTIKDFSFLYSFPFFLIAILQSVLGVWDFCFSIFINSGPNNVLLLKLDLDPPGRPLGLCLRLNDDSFHLNEY